MRRALEVVVGTGLLLGPLVYALTLDDSADELESPALAVVEVGEPAEPCEQPEVVPEPSAKPTSNPTRVVASLEPELAEFLFVTDAGVVLSADAERGWGKGRLFEPEGTVSYRAAKRADSAKLPTALWSRAGRTYDLYGPEGKVCTARLGELRVLGQYDGWSVGGLLGGEWYDSEEQPSKSEIRKALWERDDLWLVAEIAATESCEGALWARDAELPPPALLRESTAANEISKRRIAEFQRSEELAGLEEYYDLQYTESAKLDPERSDQVEAFDVYARKHPAKVSSWLDTRGQPRLVHLAFGRSEDGCGDTFAINYAELAFVEADAFVPSSQTSDPMAVFDADGDGQLELLFSGYEGDPQLVSATLGQGVAVEYDSYCPC